MLIHLSIRNYVLIQELDMDFFEGLSIITGETGAGKSILLGALGLLAGARADSATLLDKSRKCVVEGTFRMDAKRWKRWFADHELDAASETIIRREVSAEGKSRAFVNDSPVNLSILKELGAELIDIHSQHQNIYLESPAFQLQILDTYAQSTEAAAKYADEYNQCRSLEGELASLTELSQREQAEAEYHRFRYDELCDAHLLEDEQAALEEEQETLTHAEEIKTGLLQAGSCLNDDETSAIQLLRSATSALEHVERVYPKAGELKERIETTIIELKDVSSEAERIADDLEVNPGRLDKISARLDSLYSLQQKHKVSSVAELITIRDGLERQLQGAEDRQTQITALQQQIGALHARLREKAAALSAQRSASAKDIENQVSLLLGQLGIAHAVFHVEVTPTAEPTPTGMDRIRFLFSANKQQNLQEIGKVASGGELSRIMLAIKAAIAGKIVLPTLIFDEIDAGVSGEIAEKMGTIIERMGGSTQVVNITHLPQIASKGAHHYKVYKRDSAQGTHTQVRLLTPEERVLEIARILSGEHVSEAAVENARHLLKYT